MSLTPIMVTSFVDHPNMLADVTARCPYGDFTGVLQYAGPAPRRRRS